ncbi:helicase HerA domain-containing protein [Thermomonospora cellulosilytica]|uniref:S-DNA-T family DNA segregation ATPase FtsK/SpoIIIE n=1 Tax=Thermomonospora cellulosilytica TaxID=1411118 RepID=A0A7W3N1N5_9ACTN|nr:DUF87 domain-containing protein [Thermomonospora cellulosilytica]MBA9005868.1 S-DNA-T family DNA segregation ATPase FtsK/SpoIIIE [Thermomonospora cellulosilytica]
MSPRISWSPRHGPVMLPVQAAAGLFTTAAVSHWTPLDLPFGWTAAGAAAGLGLLWWRGRLTGLPARTMAYQCGTWAAGSGWLLYTQVNGLGWNTTFTLAVGAAVAGAAAAPIHAHRQHKRQEHLRHLRSMELRKLATEWEDRIWSVCRIRVRVLGIERQFNDAGREVGYTVEIELPDNGTGHEDIAKYAARLTNASRLPWGCEVQVLQGADPWRVLLEVATYNALGPVIPITQAGPSTINDPLRLGKRRDISEGAVSLRWHNWVIVGSGGSGKTNLVRTIINRLLECEDALAIVIDPNGGGVARPYLDPWVEGLIDRRPLLVASDEEEITFVVEFLQALISARMRSQYEAMVAVDDDKVPVSNRVPQIVVLVDESHSLPNRIQQGLIDVSNRSRGGSIRIVYTALRGTGDKHLPRPILAQGTARFILGVNDAGEADNVVRDKQRPAITALPPGFGNVRITGQALFLMKFYRTTPQSARECAIRTAGWRPAGLEPESLELMPEALVRRWLELWNRRGHAPAATSGTRTGRTRTETGGTRTGTGTGAGAGTGGTGRGRRPSVQEALDNLRNARDRIRKVGRQPGPDETSGPGGTGTGGTGGTGGEGRPEDRFEDVIAGAGFGLEPELLVRLQAAFKATGHEEMPTEDLAAFIGAAKSDMGRLLPQIGVYALKNPFRYPGRQGRVRGYALADIRNAVEAIRAGALQVPPEVAAWTSTKPLPDDQDGTP